MHPSGDVHRAIHDLPLEAYMVVNFKARGISRDTYKLARISMLIKKNI